VSTSGTQPRVSIIILTWNRVEDIVGCLDSFSVLEYPNYEVIVVDNASEDETVPTVRERYSWATLIVNDDNLGYVGGNNVGIRYALEKGTDYVFILNSDTKVTPDVLSQLVQVAESDPHIAICGAKNLLMEDGHFTWGAYGRLTWGPMLVKTVGRFEPDRPEITEPMDVDWVIGNGCLMRASVLNEIGLFDEAFFQVHEDVDWCTRAHEAGHRVVYVPRAAFFHKGASSADFTKPRAFSYGYFLGRNPIMFARKHANVLQWAKLLTMLTLGLLLRTSFYAARAVLQAVGGQQHFFHGLMDGFTGRLRRDHIVVRIPLPSRIPPDTRIMRLLRWLGA
jgi:GT2 family glycosyltransferase